MLERFGMEDKQTTREQQLESELAKLRQAYQLSAEIIDALSTNESPEVVIRQVGNTLKQAIPYESFTLKLQTGWRYRLKDTHFEVKELYDISNWENSNASAMRWVQKNRRPLLRRDISKEQRFERDKTLILEGTISQLILPLLVNGEMIAAFKFTSTKANCYDKGHQEIAQSIGNAIAPALIQFESRQEVLSINKITAAIQESLNLDEILKMILDHIHRQGYDRVRVYLYDNAQDALKGFVQMGQLPHTRFTDHVFRLELFPEHRKKLFGKQPWISKRTPEYIELMDQVVEKHPFIGLVNDKQEWAEIPLVISEAGQDVLVGQITVDNIVSTRPLVQDSLDKLAIYASQAAIAIRHAQLYKHMEELVEARTTELEQQVQRGQAMLHINQVVQAMQRAPDLEQVMNVCLEETEKLGLDIQAIAIHRIIDETNNIVETFRACSISSFFSPSHHRKSIQLTECWKTGQTFIEKDIEMGEAKYVIKMRNNFDGLSIRSFVDTPFSLGVVSAHSIHPNAFSELEADILEQIGVIFSVGISRMEDLKQVEGVQQSLQISESLHRGAIEAIDGIPYHRDYDSNVYRYIGNGIQELTGYSQDEWTPDVFGSIVLERNNLDSLDEWNAEFLIKTYSGAKKWIADAARPVKDKTGKVIATIGILRDITRQKQFDREIIQLQRLRAKGELSAGVSHNLNNILTGILGPAQMLQTQTDDPALLTEVNAIIASSLRAKDLVHRLHLSTRGADDSLAGTIYSHDPTLKSETKVKISSKNFRAGDSFSFAMGVNDGAVLHLTKV
jgi:PAS domain-containing protein